MSSAGHNESSQHCLAEPKRKQTVVYYIIRQIQNLLISLNLFPWTFFFCSLSTPSEHCFETWLWSVRFKQNVYWIIPTGINPTPIKTETRFRPSEELWCEREKGRFSGRTARGHASRYVKQHTHSADGCLFTHIYIDGPRGTTLTTSKTARPMDAFTFFHVCDLFFPVNDGLDPDSTSVWLTYVVEPRG